MDLSVHQAILDAARSLPDSSSYVSPHRDWRLGGFRMIRGDRLLPQEFDFDRELISAHPELAYRTEIVYVSRPHRNDETEHCFSLRGERYLAYSKPIFDEWGRVGHELVGFANGHAWEDIGGLLFKIKSGRRSVELIPNSWARHYQEMEKMAKEASKMYKHAAELSLAINERQMSRD